MKRTKPRPDWGWETPMDLYDAIEARLGTGDLSYRRDRTMARPPAHIYEWFVKVAGNTFAARSVIPGWDIQMRPVREIAEEVVMAWRIKLDDAVRLRREQGN